MTVEYDRLGRPVDVTVDGDPAASTTYTYSLDSPSWIDPSGSYSATLDSFDRQISLTDPLIGGWAFAYRADGQPLTIGAPNGNTTTYGYDDAAMLSAKTTTSGSTNRVSYSWSRNRVGQVVGEQYTLGTDTMIPAGYEYDSIGRLVAFTRDGATTSYGWQAVPNRDSVQVASDPATTLGFDAANRVSTSGYGHDAENRLTARPGQVLEWDALGRLTEVTDGSTTLASYTYDALDRLLVVDRGSSDIIRVRYVGLTTQVAEIVDDDSADARIRAFANDWTGSRLLDWTCTNERYYGTNGHHDVSWTADDSGAVIATLRYDPWGNLTSSTGTSLPDHRFQGSWLDSTTDLYWVVARWYAPSLGRFVSEDTMLGQPEDPPSRHLYAYSAGEPVGRWDPSGRYWLLVNKKMNLSGLATLKLGTHRAWTALWHANRVRVPAQASPSTWISPGTCLFIPVEWLRPARAQLPDTCNGGEEPRVAVRSVLEAQRAQGLADDIAMNFTPEWLHARTDRQTRRQRSPNGELWRLRLATNVWALNSLADLTANLGGRRTWSRHAANIRVIAGISAPWCGGANCTLGQYIFVPGGRLDANIPLLAHEYIHVLQYEGLGIDMVTNYLNNEAARVIRNVTGQQVVNFADLLAFGRAVAGLNWAELSQASTPMESTAYLWGAYTSMASDPKFASERPWRIWKPAGHIRPW